MGYYILRRLFMLIPILLGVSFVFFGIFNIVGGSEKFIYSFLPQKGNHEKQYELYKEKLGFNDPYIIQYLRFTKDMFTFNFGVSQTKKRKVTDIIKRHAPISAMLAFPPFIIEIVIGMTIAMLAAYYRGKVFDRIISALTVIGMSIPTLVLIILLQKVLAGELRLFPIQGFKPVLSGGLKYFYLPWLIWIIIGIGPNTKFFRATFINETNQDYVRTALAKGQSKAKVLIYHVFPNALIPILTYIVLTIPYLLLGSFLLERFFSIPGLGDLIIGAINSYDLPVLKASVTFFTYFFVLFTLLTDILYVWVDPRIKLK